jgi:hypothetical protein
MVQDMHIAIRQVLFADGACACVVSVYAAVAQPQAVPAGGCVVVGGEFTVCDMLCIIASSAWFLHVCCQEREPWSSPVLLCLHVCTNMSPDVLLCLLVCTNTNPDVLHCMAVNSKHMGA